MQRLSRTFLFPVLLAHILLLMLLFLQGMFFEEGTDPYFTGIFSGAFHVKPEAILGTYGFHIYVSYVYAFLFSHWPALPWYGLVVFSMAATALGLGFHLLLSAFRDAHPVLRMLAGLMLFLAWHESLCLIQITRLSFLLAGVCGILLLQDEGKTLSSIQKIFLNACMLFALLSRIEAGMLAWGILIPFALIRAPFSLREIPGRIKPLIPFALFSVLTAVAVNLPLNDAEREYKAFRPYQFSLWDFEQPGIPPKLNDRKDSLVYRAAKESFLSDAENIRPEFFERIGLNPLDKSPAQALHYLRDSSSRSAVWMRNFPAFLARYVWLFMGLCAILLLTLFFPADKGKKSGAAVFFNSILLLLSLLSAFMKMEDRVFAPVLQLGLLAMLLFIRKEPTQAAVSVCAGILLALFQLFSFTHPKIQARRVADRYLGLAKQESAEKFPDKTLWVNLHVLDRLFIRVFDARPFPLQMKVRSIDNAILCYYPSWKESMRRECGGWTFPEVMKGMLADAQRSVFLSTPGRMQLLQEYADAVWNIRFSFRPLGDRFNDAFRNEFPGYETPYEIHFYAVESE